MGMAGSSPSARRDKSSLKPFLVPDTQAKLFSPARNLEERSATLRLARKTKVQPSQQARRKRKPKKRLGLSYNPQSYGRAITAAIKRHNEKTPPEEHIPHWHPHQLRHTRAAELKREAGLDIARAVLGHRSPTLTEHYAGLDLAAAATAMERLG